MQDKDYLKRCFDLAKLGGRDVRPNPHVGAVIVYNDRIIGEGYHKMYGDHHAEVNAVNNVSDEDRQFLPQSTMFVSLEPCCHFGITPPCTDLIIKNKIRRVCIAEIDPNQKVNSKGINQLKESGVEVHVIAEFRANQIKQKPFIQLKFAKSKDNYIGLKEEQVWLSNEKTSIYTHKLRSYTDAILIGTNTALIDNPSLTLRNFPGNSPIRIVLDREGKIPLANTLLSDKYPTIIITQKKRKIPIENKEQIQIDFSNENFIENLLEVLFEKEIKHLLVEGGAQLFKSFLKSNCWNEAVVIQTQKTLLQGIKAPNINGRIISKDRLGSDKVTVIRNTNPA